MVVIHRFGEITDHSIHHRAVSSHLIRVSGDENRRDHGARIAEVSMELDTTHDRHLHVADQARGRSEERGR
jgi:hypothetical protein